MKRIKWFFLTCLIASSLVSWAQVGGRGTYAFLNLQASARIAALGGNLISVKDDDVNLALYNPSLLNQGMDQHLALNYVNYFSDVNFGHAVYSRSISNLGSFSGGIQYINYGDFVRADATGQKTGTFSASEYALVLGWARELDSMFTAGINLKPVFSSLDDYNSIGIATDIAVTYHRDAKQFTATALIKNLGRQVKTYRPGNREPLPFEIQVGISKRLEHMPFRLSVIAHHLETPDLTYENPQKTAESVDPITGEPIEQKQGIADKIARHFIFGGEFLPSKNFSIRLGYNYQRRQELKVDTKLSTVGISWGVGFRVSKFRISYGRAAYHLAGPSNHFTITTDLASFGADQKATP